MLSFLDLRRWSRPAVIAHRGASRLYPENTLAAFEAAAAAGADAVEFDVRRTADGVLVVHHDPTLLPRQGSDAGPRPLGACTLEEVRAHGRTLGVEIPTVQEVLQLCAGRIAIDVELKEEGYERDVVSLVASHYEPANAVFTSFRAGAVSAIARETTGFLAGLVIGERRGSWPAGMAVGDRLLPLRLARCRAALVCPHASRVRAAFMMKMRSTGRPVFVWTVDDPGLARRLAADGVAAIITNDPRGIREALATTGHVAGGEHGP